MPLTLIKESGAGLANANAYADLADGDAYHAGHLYASAWTAATADNKAVALVMASRLPGPDENPQGQFSDERPGPGRGIIGRLVLGNSQDNTVQGGHGVGMVSRMKAALSHRS